MSLWPHAISILISNWPQTRKFNLLFKCKSREDRCFSLPSPYSRVGHALRPILKLWLVKIWQVSSCGKFIQHLETYLLWQLKLREFFCQLVMFLSVFFHWMHKMKYSCYQDRESSVIHDWFVYWIFGWEMRRLSKSEIRFRMASFSLTMLDAGWKSLKRFWPYLIAFRSCISNGNPE